MKRATALLLALSTLPAFAAEPAHHHPGKSVEYRKPIPLSA